MAARQVKLGRARRCVHAWRQQSGRLEERLLPRAKALLRRSLLARCWREWRRVCGLRWWKLQLELRDGQLQQLGAQASRAARQLQRRGGQEGIMGLSCRAIAMLRLLQSNTLVGVESAQVLSFLPVPAAAARRKQAGASDAAVPPAGPPVWLAVGGKVPICQAGCLLRSGAAGTASSAVCRSWRLAGSGVGEGGCTVGRAASPAAVEPPSHATRTPCVARRAGGSSWEARSQAEGVPVVAMLCTAACAAGLAIHRLVQAHLTPCGSPAAAAPGSHSL